MADARAIIETFNARLAAGRARPQTKKRPQRGGLSSLVAVRTPGVDVK